MKQNKVLLGQTPLKTDRQEVSGGFVELGGERFYKISNYDMMPPFFMSIVSAGNHWLFISSTGSLTAGRKNAGHALFPYYTEDKIHDFAGKTGNRTIILAEKDGQTYLWEPFTDKYPYVYSIRRNIYKNLYGNKLLFEEINEDLSLAFSYGWFLSNKYGFVKKSKLTSRHNENITARVLDGLLNILPYGVDSNMQTGFSYLLDAYKKHELDAETGIGIFRLSSIPVDTAEPSESLKATTVWSTGLTDPKILLSERQIEQFKSNQPVQTEHSITAVKGAYLVDNRIELPSGQNREWQIIAEVDQDVAALISLREMLAGRKDHQASLDEDITKCTNTLIRIISCADALQKTHDEPSTSRHLANVLFNVMRGGLFERNYQVDRKDFLEFIRTANKHYLEQAATLTHRAGSRMMHEELVNKARENNDPDLVRLCHEYLPVSFSRRHGDPSRPWNIFSIETEKEDGSKSYSYQGNWRDIFQNWEALSISFPEYVESMICKFVNASTPDGYNPYRITRQGIDWEKPDPADPWSNIGYWGDHQIIYLLKLLEISRNHHPDRLSQYLSQDIFCYANTPYRIKPYREITTDPHDTIEFDHGMDALIEERTEKTGSDGKLLWNGEGKIIYVNLAEKLLVPLLAKITNYIPGGGIWMNTQRPEWNDANNALVGYGVSVVTAAYLRRYIKFCHNLFMSVTNERFPISEEVAGLMNDLNAVFSRDDHPGSTVSSAKMRKQMMDELGSQGSGYREQIYQKGFSGKKQAVTKQDLISFFDELLKHIDHTLKVNRRSDGLYHAYNLLRFTEKDRAQIRYLYEMLEGQVAIISSGLLTPEECLEVLDQLKKSALFRKDQYSYILYPYRDLDLFMEINTIPRQEVSQSELMQQLIRDGNKQIIVGDIHGNHHFNGRFRNAKMLREALTQLPDEYRESARAESGKICSLFEQIFDHESFTGRSGTFYGFEGLGSIYWHMVSKLLLAVCETCYRAWEAQAAESVLKRLAGHYYEIRAGIGLNKNPGVYGSFPTDPYSHTPADKGAQQPGLTGQVKEDILSRWGELGVLVRKGRISFQPILLRKAELMDQETSFTCYDSKGNEQVLRLDAGSLAFTYCQVPVIYRRSDERKLVVHHADGQTEEISGHTLDRTRSELVFSRTGAIDLIEVWLQPAL